MKFKQLYDIQYYEGINIIWSIGIIQKWEGWVKVLWGMGIDESGFFHPTILKENAVVLDPETGERKPIDTFSEI